MKEIIFKFYDSIKKQKMDQNQSTYPYNYYYTENVIGNEMKFMKFNN